MSNKNNPNVLILLKIKEIIKLINIHTKHFPSHEKYCLSLTIKNSAIQLYGLIIECMKRYYKKTTLSEMDITHEQLRMYVNLAYELGYYGYYNGKSSYTKDDAYRRYTAITVLIDELGKMIGGWIKHLKEIDV